MNRLTIISVIIVIIAIVATGFFHSIKQSPSGQNINTGNFNTENSNSIETPPVAANDNTPATNATTPPRGYNAAPISDFVPPIDNFAARITKKPFGIYITPATSPVQPERFQGYHTGDDAETTADEQYKDVPIVSMADGEVILARYVSGYGGVMMIVSTIKGQTVTALYGHLRLSSLTKKVGNNAKKGEKIGVLGTGYTSETDGERKHLHFGILKGRSTNVKGYVSSKAALTDWNDPLAWLKEQGAL